MHTRIRNTICASAAGLCLAAGSAQAIEGEVGGHFANYDDFDSGVGIHGHLDVIPQARLSGQFTSADLLDRLRFGGGYLLQLDSLGLELELGGSYQFWDFDGPPEDDVYGVHAIGSYAVLDELDVRGKLEFVTFDIMEQDSPVIGFGAGYDITPQITAGLDVEIFLDDAVDQTFLQLGASYRF